MFYSSGVSYSNKWEIKIFYGNNNLLFKSSVAAGGKEKFVISVNFVKVLLALISPVFLLLLRIIPLDLVIDIFLLIAFLFFLLPYVDDNIRKNHFCEHYTFSLLEKKKKEEKWYNDDCTTLNFLRNVIFLLEYLLIRLTWADHIYIILFLTFNALLFIYWEKVKRAWQWLFMAKPEKWRLKLAFQQAQEIKKIIENNRP